MHKKSLHDIVRSFAGKTVLIVGDLILDEYVWGKVRRISPEAPVPVVEFEKRTHRLGGAANVAANVQSLGGTALLASAIGTDQHGSLLLELLESAGMNVDGILTLEDCRTTTKSRLMAQNQQIARVDDERIAPLSPKREEELLSWVQKQMSKVDACVTSDYGKGLISPPLGRTFHRPGSSI